MGDGEPGPVAMRRPEPNFAIRLLGVAVLAALVVASGLALSRGGVRTAAGAPGGAPLTGAWFCPHGGGDGWKGWVSVANPGTVPVGVRVTTFGTDRAPAVRSFTVPAHSEAYREVVVTDPAASTEVEYFGGWVAAATVLQSSGSHPDVAAERCVAGLARGWFLPDVPTSTDSHTSLVVVNPYDTIAEFDVVIRTNTRRLTPGELSPVVVKPNRSTSIDVEWYALEGQGEDTVTAQVVPKVGRVIAGSLVSSPQGVRAAVGIAAQSPRWLIPSAGYGGSARLVVMNVGAERAVLSATAEGPTAAAEVPGLAGVAMDPGAVQTFDVGQLANAGFDIHTGSQGAVALSLRVDGPQGGIATVDGTPDAHEGWVVLPSLPASGGAARLVLQNPGKAPAAVSVTLLGPNGTVGAQGLAAVTVPPGATVSLILPPSDVPLAAVVVATSGSIVAGGSAQALGGAGFAASTGVPMP